MACSSPSWSCVHKHNNTLKKASDLGKLLFFCRSQILLVLFYRFFSPCHTEGCCQHSFVFCHIRDMQLIEYEFCGVLCPESKWSRAAGENCWDLSLTLSSKAFGALIKSVDSIKWIPSASLYFLSPHHTTDKTLNSSLFFHGPLLRRIKYNHLHFQGAVLGPNQLVWEYADVQNNGHKCPRSSYCLGVKFDYDLWAKSAV